MSKPKIILTGANGQLGLSIQALFQRSDLQDEVELLCLSRQDLDISKALDIASVLPNDDILCLINAAAYTAVDKAESEQESAALINAEGAKNLALWTAQHQLKLIQISTDFVFDGQKTVPYLPEDPCSPLCVYGDSKLAGENAVLHSNPDQALVLRTSWLYSAYRANFLLTMLRLMNERKELAVVNDQFGSPTSTASLAEAVLVMATANIEPGVYHWSDAGVASWYDFAKAIQEEGLAAGLLEQKIPLAAITSKEYPTPAARPVYSVLDSSKTENALEIATKPWRDQLKLVIEEIASNRNS